MRQAVTYMEKLLEGVEVEWKSLGEVCKFTYGFTAKSQDNGNARFVRITDINLNGELIPTNRKYVDITNHNKKYLLKKNDLLMARTGASYGKTVIFKENYPAIFAGFLIKLSFDNNIVNPKYYWHFAQSHFFWDQANKLVTSGGQPQFNANVLKEVIFPIPPLHVQKEIVRILDKFTALTTELKTELTARKKQYNHYRDQLLNFNDRDVEWKPLGNFSAIYDGVHQTPKYTNSGVPFVSVQNIKDLYATNKFISQEDFNKYKYKPKINDLFMTRIGDIGSCAIVENNDPLAYYVTLSLIRINPDTALPKFVKHFIESKFGKAEIKKKSLMHAVPIKINLRDIGKILIPIPPLHVQKEIVRILDKFDDLAHSNEGLLKEVELRKKQYKYYHDNLLNFENYSVKWMPLDKVLMRNKGIKITTTRMKALNKADGPIKIFSGGDGFAFIDYNDIPNEYILKKPSIIVKSFGKVKFEYYDKPFSHKGQLWSYYSDRQEINIKFIYFFLKNQENKFQNIADKRMISQIFISDMDKLLVPVPPLERQKEIVAILDKFETLINSLTDGIPKEIKLREKQFNYYRSLLLSFPKKYKK